jgi:nucleoside-diphosphate-sugar epimerase
MRNYVLLTGATGLLGKYLLRDFLLAGHRMAVLVRANKSQTAEQRVEQDLQMWERQLKRSLPRPVVITGDITDEDLGLSKADREWVQADCTTMLHCAASLAFQQRGAEPWRTNVDGTRHVLRLCSTTAIREMHYISTAYVCGIRHDLVREDELETGQEFRNVYEQSKCEAEKLVRKSDFDSLTIYRPVVITGDSQTGYTSTYHGSYLYMKLASMLQKYTEPNEKGEYHVPIRWGLTGDERRNVTPVDWNSRVIAEIFNNSAALGRTFHLAPEDPITMREAIHFACRYYRLTGIEFHGFGKKPDHTPNEMERWLWSNISLYGSYDFMDPRFDRTNLETFVSIPCPKFDWELTLRLLQYAEADRWGKRKPPAIDAAEIEVAELLQNCCEPHANGSRTITVGLRVTGRGGGDWNLSLAGDRLVSYSRGLPSPGTFTPTFCISCRGLSGLIEHPERADSELALQQGVDEAGHEALRVTRCLTSFARPIKAV